MFLTVCWAAVQGIIATVGQTAITQSDLSNRIQLLGVSPDLSAQVLDNLIDEVLQINAAKKENIIISQKEIDDYIAGLAKDQGIMVEKYKAGLGSQLSSLQHKVKAQLAWVRYVRYKYGSFVHITDNETNQMCQKLTSEVSKPQYKLHEIFVRGSGDNLSAIKHKVESNQVNFEDMAYNISQSASAAKGGDIGWFFPCQLPDARIASLKPNQLLLTQHGNGMRLFWLKAIRYPGQADPAENKIQYLKFIVPLPQDLQQVSEAKAQKIKVLVESKNCQVLTTRAKDLGINVSMTDDVAGNFPTGLLNVLRNNKVVASRIPEGIGVQMLCSFTEAKYKMPTREEVQDIIKQDKLTQKAIFELHNLRRRAHIVKR